MDEYDYNDPSISYNEPLFQYNGGFDGAGVQIRRRQWGGSGSSTSYAEMQKKRNIFEILIRTSKLNEDKTTTRVYQINKDSGIKIRSRQIITNTDDNSIKISGSLIL
jgi:hypothetical protein